MTHPEALALFDDYFDNKLDRMATRRFHGHINVCEDCQVRIRVTRASVKVPTTRADRTAMEDRAQYEKIIYRNRIMMMAVVIILAMFFFFFKLKRG